MTRVACLAAAGDEAALQKEAEVTPEIMTVSGCRYMWDR